MRKDIETHPSVHLLQIFPIIQRKNLRQFHQRMIVHCGGAPIHFENRRRSQHVLPLDMPIRLSSVKPLYSKVTRTHTGRHQLGFRHDDSAVRSAIHIGFFHRAAILHLIGSWKLDDPLIRHDLRSCAAGTAAHLEQFIQIARILVIQYRMTLSGKLVQIINRSILLDIPSRTIRQRAHSRIADDRQTLQPCHIRRKNSPRL